MTKKGYQKNKYLDDLGISIKSYGVNFCDKTDSRWKRWKKQRKKYSFDERETWNIDSLFVEWIYSRFMMYKEINCVDLTFWHFNYKGKKNEITQEEAINIILRLCKQYLFTEETNIKKYDIFKKENMALLGDLLPHMWW